MKKIVIYGMGNYGIRIADVIIKQQSKLDMEVIGICDKKEQRNIETKFYFPYDLESLDYDLIVVTSKKWYEAIKRELSEKYNINPSQIVLFSDLNEWIRLIDGDKFYCNICRNSINILLPTGVRAHNDERKKITGGGYRQNCICPICGSNDRSRWLQYILETETNIFNGNNKILHFAPETGIEKGIREKNTGYITADIVAGGVDVIEDITNISYDDNTFDYIICNHVMEHIEDEDKAFSEIKRCIKYSGSIVMSVPICWDELTYEDKTIITPKQRREYYGQEEHVRLYGNDFEQRLKNYGFQVKRMSVDKQKYEDLVKLSLIYNDTIWILRKE